MLNAQQLAPNPTLEQETSALQPWIVCFTAALFFFYEFIQMNMFNAISPDLMRTFSLTGAELGNLAANYFYANLIFLLPAGLILDHFSTRKIIMLAMSICVLGTLAFATATNLYIAQLARFATGIGSAFCFLSCIRLASRWFPAQQMALVTGLIITMAMLGGMVAQTPLAALSADLGWRDTLILDASLGIFILSVIWTFVQDFPPNSMSTTTLDLKYHKRGFIQSLRCAYLNSQNWLCGIYTCLMNLPISLLGALWGGMFLSQVHHLSATQASYITTMIFGGTIVGAPLAGWISDSLNLRKLPMFGAAILSFLTVLIIILLPIQSIKTLMLLFFMLGLFTSAQVISYPIVAESNPKTLTATSVSVVSFTTIGGYAISQPLFGWLMDLHWSGFKLHNQPIYSVANYHFALSILPISFIIALIATLFIRETFGKTVEA